MNSSQIWFATDPIRPGVTATCNAGTGCPKSNDYIYNIMAKGYASLDDWCMSQAQQSTMANVRNVASWTAMIIAQPDNSGHFGVLASQINEGFLSLANGKSSYYSPNSKNVFSALDNLIYDKNLNQQGIPGAQNTSFWFGLNKNYCPSNVNENYSCPSPFDSDCRFGKDTCGPVSTTDCSGYAAFDNSLGAACGHFGPSLIRQSNLALGPFPERVAGTINSWGDYSGQTAGVLVLTPHGCGSGFDLATDCGGGATYQANSTQQKPVICLEKQ